MKLIHITTGDPDGIGLEVALKALNKIRRVKGVQFVLWRSNCAPKDMFHLLNKQFKIVTVKELKFLKELKKTEENVLWDLALPEQPTQWVAQAGALCLKNPHAQALVTGPLSKTQMQKEGFKERGHTALLKKISKVPHVYMCFLGDDFNVTLLTGHTPLKKIQWSEKDLDHCIKLCLDVHPSLVRADQTIGVLGLNPHAGEEGLLGTEDIALKRALCKWMGLVEGPLIPDVAFFKENWTRFFMYICMYHDQGLIPFKMVHGRKSFQVSLGLPFMRVSVSHGTAKDIYGQNKADLASMRRAILWAIRSLTGKKA